MDDIVHDALTHITDYDSDLSVSDRSDDGNDADSECDIVKTRNKTRSRQALERPVNVFLSVLAPRSRSERGDKFNTESIWMWTHSSHPEAPRIDTDNKTAKIVQDYYSLVLIVFRLFIVMLKFY